MTSKATATRKRAGYISITALLPLLVTACSSPATSDGPLVATSTAAATTTDAAGPSSDRDSQTPTEALTPDKPVRTFSLTLHRTTEAGYTYTVTAAGQLGDVITDPSAAPIGQTVVAQGVQLSSLELTNTSGRTMDVGQDDLYIGGVGMVAAWPNGSPICRVFASQWALPDGRCGGGLAELKLPDDMTPIPPGEPQTLQLFGTALGRPGYLAFQVDDTAAAQAEMQAALEDAATCLVVVKPGTSDAAHTPGKVFAATCSAG